ncbi:DNA (cytosine-5-)-methyltransferase [Hungatella hathewayi]|jgi:DNA (cytosine-5)-methyltransferase 1|uniref:DNA (cytosine-5-)-methyltransferase n=2 Tax=Hungatella hathewayi TaxID=154046 RepID=UPI002443900E|nr:DNA (cytosine-5-)-methyltransferase [Hungatella hathewayi]
MGMTFIDFFAGIGGFRRGMELAGHRCIGFCEYDKYAVASYTSMHLITAGQREHLMVMDLKCRQKEIMREEYKNGEWYANDIRTVEAGSLPRADCWCFGFPCQDISIAGKQLGFSGRRSSLFFAVTGLIKDLEEENRPGVLFIENVKNLLSVNRGLDFAKLLIELDEIGYDAEWCLLNSKDFGVPQNRERVFIIGHLRGRGGRKVFPLGETDGIHNEPVANREKKDEIACCLMAGSNDKWQGSYVVKQIGNCMPTATRDNPNQGRIYDPSGISPCLNKMDGGGREPLVPISMTRKEYKETDIANTLTAGTPDKKRGNYSPVTGVMVSGVYTGVSEDYRRPPLKGISRCLKSEKHDARIFDGARIRKLTPRECFRLQGWTDEYFDRAAMLNSDSQLYKQAGNGVTVSVIQAIAERL